MPPFYNPGLVPNLYGNISSDMEASALLSEEAKPSP